MLAEPDITLAVSGAIDPNAAAALPASHGVVCFSRASDTISVLASADVRTLVLDRLGTDASPEHDLRGTCDRIRCWLCGSSFEADLRFLDVAAALAPELASQAAGRLTVWWLCVDRGRPGEGWSITDRPAHGQSVSVLGPFLDRSSARRWSEMLDDLFELCRYPAELRKVPGGTACAYHEMGRCPAACNGSEPMETYNSRLRDAVALDAYGISVIAGELREGMQQASASADFERAGVLRDRLDGLPSPGERWVQAVGYADRLDAIAVVPPKRGTMVDLLRVDRFGWRKLGTIDVKSDRSSSNIASVLTWPLETDGLPAIGGVLARELIRPRRGGPVLIHTADASPERVWSAARRAARIGSDTDSANERDDPGDD